MPHVCVLQRDVWFCVCVSVCVCVCVCEREREREEGRVGEIMCVEISDAL